MQGLQQTVLSGYFSPYGVCWHDKYQARAIEEQNKIFSFPVS